MLNLLSPTLSPMSALGQVSLLLALAFALAGLWLAVLGGVRRDPRPTEAARRLTWGVFGFATLAVLALEVALLRDDFSVRYVAEHSMRVSPTWVKVASLWGALEGSILLWAWLLAAYAFVLSLVIGRDARRPWVLATMFVSLLFFFGVNAGISSPFTPMPLTPADGLGPNAALQNHWMFAVHPVLLYLGFVGLSVPFAYAVAALITGRLNESWVVQTRRWTLVAWAFLSAAIVAGGWWSYETLGWGGYWAWDPVENASLIPWLLATAFLHSIQIQERRRMLRAWNVWLVVLAYASTVFGTFLNRSGIVQSVHAFAGGPVGPVFLGFLAFIVVAGIALASWRAPHLRDDAEIESPVSREGAYLAGNWLFLSFAFLVVLGTLFPVVVQAISGRQSSVGAPFFNAFAIPLGLGLLLLMGVGPLLPWRRAPGERLWSALRWPLTLGVVAGLLAVVLGVRAVGVALTVALSAYNVAGLVQLTVRQVRERRSFPGWLREQPRRVGAYVAHLGLLVLALGLAFSGGYKRAQEVNLQAGQPQTVLHEQLVFLNTTTDARPERKSAVARVLIDGREYRPRINYYTQQDSQPLPSPAVRYGALGDTYLVMTDFDRTNGRWVSVRLIESPLVGWIWLGTAIVVLGAGLTLLPAGRVRTRSVNVAAPAD